MAQFQYDCPRGGFTDQVTKAGGSSIGGSAVRVTIDDTNAASKEGAIKCLEAILARLVEDTWSPA
jgi:hypothetical protein